MKTKLAALFLSLFLFTNCLPDDNNDTSDQEITIVQWQLVNVTGGVAGIDYDFNMDDVIWRFDNVNNILFVQNNVTDDSIETSLDTGNYDQYLLKDEDDNLFLIVDNSDFGLIIVSENEENFTLNQNIKSTGNETDGFVYTFEREIVIIE